MTGIAAPPTLPRVPFAHLSRLSDATGLFEHAEILRPRVAHGYCVDDVARALIVLAREVSVAGGISAAPQPQPSPEVLRLAGIYRRFVFDAQSPDGRFRNRRSSDGSWLDDPSLEDCWGRALWALGTVAARTPESAASALTRFEAGAAHRSPDLRALTFAALGAAEILRVHPVHGSAQSLLADAAAGVEAGWHRGRRASGWEWPEPRLRYANAALPETLVAAGSLLGDARLLTDGLAMLSWLLDIETAGGHLSVTPVGGWAAGEPRPGFDQQPIEVAALADACGRAFDVTGEQRWQDGVRRCAAWFLGDNDVGTALYDEVSGGGCDGLERDGRNDNQGAESTLAMISTFQQAHRVCPPTR